eukprot:gene32239-16805_t
MTDRNGDTLLLSFDLLCSVAHDGREASKNQNAIMAGNATAASARFRNLAKLDVVVLQEIWVGVDAKLLMESAAKGGLSHSIHFRSGMFGSGLVTLSRYPIVESGFWRYSSAGDPAAISCGDFYAGKGFGWVRINTPCGPVDVFNTHLHANYSHMCKAVSMDMGDEEGGDGVAIMSPKSSGGASPKGLGHDEYRVPGDMAGDAARL